MKSTTLKRWDNSKRMAHIRQNHSCEIFTLGGCFPDVADLAANDGLSLADWKEWFKNYDLTQPLAVIQFTPFTYHKG